MESTSKTGREVEALRAVVLRMAQRSEEILARALGAVWERDAETAAQVARDDIEIDRLELEVDRLVLRQLALLAPVAQDLRQVVAVKTMATDLERVGDIARNIAKCAQRLHDRDPVEPPPILRKLASRSQRVLSLAIRAYADTDARLAHEILDMDDEIDSDEDVAIRESIDRITSRPDRARQEIDFIFIAQSLERVGDHATNIAEDVILVAESLNIKHAEKLSS